MEIKDITYNELEKILEESYDSELPWLDNLIEAEDTYFIEVSDNFYRIKDKGIIIAEGICYTKTDEEYQPDFDLTVIYDDVPNEEFDMEKYIYWEQDPPNVAIHNFFNIVNR